MSGGSALAPGGVRPAQTRDLDRVTALWTVITRHHAPLDPLFRMRVDAEGELRELLTALTAWMGRYESRRISDRTKAGLSKEAITGEVGQVLVVPTGEKRGKLRFPAPVPGADEWIIISQDELAIGDRVSVVDVSGNSLIVKKV